MHFRRFLCSTSTMVSVQFFFSTRASTAVSTILASFLVSLVIAAKPVQFLHTRCFSMSTAAYSTMAPWAASFLFDSIKFASETYHLLSCISFMCPQGFLIHPHSQSSSPCRSMPLQHAACSAGLYMVCVLTVCAA